MTINFILPRRGTAKDYICETRITDAHLLMTDVSAADEHQQVFMYSIVDTNFNSLSPEED